MNSVSWGAVIVAAGSGSRYGTGVPKQFLDLMGRRVLSWSLEVFQSIDEITELTVVVPSSGDTGGWTPPEGVTVVPGGARRQDSVMAGLSSLSSATHVLVHDAARPLVSRDLVLRVMEAAVKTGAAVPVLRIRDTVKVLSDGGGVERTMPRDSLALSQTPQGFHLETLSDALGTALEVTDESSVMEKTGHRVAAVEGDRMNLKITDPGDLAHLESMASGMMESRNGTGLDFHPLKSGRPLVLGGLRLKGDRGPDGHSDGDAVLHAIADAILAAARLGDIGVLFPPDDPRWKDADSRLLLKDVYRRVRHGGWSVLQLDVTVIARYPRISPVREEMIEVIAGLLDIDPKRVWVKGTTTNSLGDIGRGKGLGCLASVTLTRRRFL